MPINHRFGCAVSLNDSVYIIGGDDYKRIHKIALNEAYDITELEPMNESRRWASAAILNGKLIVNTG